MNLKRYAWMFLPGVAFLALALSTTVRPVSGASPARNGGQDTAGPLTDIKIKTVTRGEVVMTAAINSDGTVAKCYGCKTATTLHLGTGEYQVGFTGSVKASTGVARWVMPDTLQAGTLSTWCDTADRSGVGSAIWVNCQNASGPVDTSFFLFVAK